MAHYGHGKRGTVTIDNTCLDCGRKIAPGIPEEVVTRGGLIVPTPDRTCRMCLADMGYSTIENAKNDGRKVHR